MTLLSESEAIRRRELIEFGRTIHWFATDLGRRYGVTIALIIDGDGRAHFEVYDPKTKTASRRLPDTLAQKIRANRDALREYVSSMSVASPPPVGGTETDPNALRPARDGLLRQPTNEI